MKSLIALVVLPLFLGCAKKIEVSAPISVRGQALVLPERVLVLDGLAEAPRAAWATYRSGLPWLKGSTHVHTRYSGDSRTRAEDVVKWYSEAGYDFVVLTDHNRVTDGVSANLANESGMLVLTGTELTNNPPSCEPPPPLPKGKCRVHVNALFVRNYPENEKGTRPPKIEWRERKSIKRVDLYQAALSKTESLGGLSQLNHPRWHWGVDAKLTVELAVRGLKFIEIANVAFEKWNRGSATQPGVEVLWDAALTAGHRLWGIASDDAHHYFDVGRVKKSGGALYPAGGGFVMVQAEKNPDSIRRAMERGDFYSSTGILFSRLEATPDEIIVDVAKGEHRDLVIEFIGAGGEVLQKALGAQSRYSLRESATNYIRVRVQSAEARAWSQPYFLDGTKSAR